MPDVIVVGAGPVGLFLGAELHRRGVDVMILERRDAVGTSSRAIGLHAPALAALEPGGATERILPDAVRVSVGECRARVRGAWQTVGTVRFDRLRVRFPFVATLPQPLTEAALAFGGPPVVRGERVVGVRQVGDRVRVLSRRHDDDRETEWDAAAAVIAGGSGARKLVYRPGAVRVRHYPDRYLMADARVVEREDADVAVVTLAPRGVLESFPLPDGHRRFVAWVGADGDGVRGDDLGPAARDHLLRHALDERGEADAAASVSGATAFRVRRVAAPQLRRGRVLVIGDAAHEVSPIGGQGMNLGLLDAAGLAPLLARWVRTGLTPDGELGRWERRRVRSARVAGAIAAVNTGLGRPRRGAADTARALALGAALTGPSARLFAHTYAMGFDRGA